MTVKNHLTLIFIFNFLCPIVSFSQAHNKIISDKDYYDFINYLLSDSVTAPRRVLRRQIPLNSDFIFYKDSTDFKLKNKGKNSEDFIFKNHKWRDKIITHSIDTIFNREDIDFFGRQLKAMKTCKHWKKKSIKSEIIDSIDYKYTGKGFSGRETAYSFNGFSLPLFSKDKEYILIIKSNEVSSAYYIYKHNEKGEWDYVKKFNEKVLEYF